MSRRLTQLIADKVTAFTGYITTLDDKQLPTLLRKGTPVVFFPPPETVWDTPHRGTATFKLVVSVPGKGDDVESWPDLDAAFMAVKAALDDEAYGVDSQRPVDFKPESGAAWLAYEVTFTVNPITDAHY